MTNPKIINLIAHAVREADGWECDPDMNLAASDNPRAQHWGIAAKNVIAKLNAAGLFLKPDGKEWEDVVHDLNQEIEDLNRQVHELNVKYADETDRVDVAGKMAEEVVELAKKLVAFTGR